MATWLDDRRGFAQSDSRSHAIGRAWVRETDAKLTAAFGDVAPENVEATAVAAEELLHDAGLCEAMLLPLIQALRVDPAFAPPLRMRRDVLRTGVVIHEGAHATLSASVLSADALAALPPTTTVVASGRMSVVRYCKAGDATLRIWDAPMSSGDLNAGRTSCAEPANSIALTDGLVLQLDGRMRAHLIDNAASDVVTLTMTLRHGALPQVREYARGDGQLVRAAAIDETESRTRMLLTLLRVSGRADASACFDAATREPSFALRWSAMREWLAVDARGALPRLAEMTDDANAEVRTAARATLAMVERRIAA